MTSSDRRRVWVSGWWCYDHGDNACDCERFMKAATWRLYVDGGFNYGAAIQQFYADGPFYGTWECGGGGRTGAVETFEACREHVENAVSRAVRPN